MAQDDPTVIATGNPAWLVPDGSDDSDAVAADLTVEDMRHGPATVASITLTYDDGSEAGTEVTLDNVLAMIRQLEAIAAQAIIDGYGTGAFRDDALEERDEPFREYFYTMVGEVNDGTETVVEQIDGREEYSDHDRYFWTLYGVAQDETAEALYDADTEEEIVRVARLMPGAVYRKSEGSWTLVMDGDR